VQDFFLRHHEEKMNALFPTNTTDLSSILSSRMEIYLINLDRSADRLARMDMELSRLGLKFERVAAVDGKELTLPMREFDERGYRRYHGRIANVYEIGCYLSHVRCAERLLASSASHALVLEDDLHLDDDLVPVLHAALDEQKEWDLLRLSTVNSGRKFDIRKLTDHRGLAVSLTREKGSGAYLINRKAAQWIKNDLVPMRLPYDLAFDLEHLSGLRALFVNPVPIKQTAERQSLIQNRLKMFRLPNTAYITVLPVRAFMEASRFSARLARLVVEMGKRVIA
jgi:glycosyl transferase family 25